jgi:hypothetical protein
VCSIATAAKLAEELDTEIQTGMKRWTYVIIALVAVPFLAFFIQTYYMLTYDSNFVETFWWWVFYEYHYFLMAWMIVYKVANLTLSCHQIYRTLCMRVSRGEVLYMRDVTSDPEGFAAVAEEMGATARRNSRLHSSAASPGSRPVLPKFDIESDERPNMSPLQVQQDSVDVPSSRGGAMLSSDYSEGLSSTSAAASAIGPNQQQEDSEHSAMVPDWNVARLSYLNPAAHEQQLVEMAYKNESIAGTAALLDYLGSTRDRGVRLMGVLMDPNFALRLGYVVVFVSFGIFSTQFLN